MPQKTIFITGTTASGKSALAIRLAQQIQGEIVNADAYQVYQEIPLLTAAPSQEEQHTVPHHLFGFLSVTEDWDASRHYHKATQVIQNIHQRGKTAIIVGGSGLYVKFLSHGLSPAPPSSPELRTQLEATPLPELVARFQQLDPEGAAATNLTNPRYVVRNLEIILTGGKPLSAWKGNWDKPALGPGFYLTYPTDELEDRIKKRSFHMLTSGTLDEVKNIQNLTLSATAQKTLGLTLIQDYLAQQITYEECATLLTLRTRQYAKRQRTWLRREKWLTSIPANNTLTSFFFAEQILHALE